MPYVNERGPGQIMQLEGARQVKKPKPIGPADIITTAIVGGGTFFVASRLPVLGSVGAGIIGLGAMFAWVTYTRREPTVEDSLATHTENGWYHKLRSTTSFGGITE